MSTAELPSLPRAATSTRPPSDSSAPAYGPDLRDAVLAAFSGRVRPVAVSWSYRLALFGVAVLMLLLPLVYVALVVASCAGVVLWTILGYRLQMALLGGFYPRLQLALTLIASMIVLVLLKPLFAPRRRGPHRRALLRPEAPVLYAFVDRVAEAVGAPAPRRIEVDYTGNAAAGFRGGLGSLVRRDLVLTLGLTLVDGITLSQLAGVVAHELGHFRQGTAMRLGFLIRSVNAWFYRVVYERDRWDPAFENTSRNIVGRALVAIPRLGIAFNRKVLAGLMWLGHAASCSLTRQMEYDADRYNARLVGVDVFVDTLLDLRRLERAVEQSFATLQVTWREGRLCRSLPDLVAVHRRSRAVEIERSVQEELVRETTGRFNTHPSVRERIGSARREKDPPVFRSDLPARIVFHDFSALAAAVSLDHYRQVVDPRISPRQLVDVEQTVSESESLQEERRSGESFWMGLSGSPRPLSLPAGVHRGAADELVRELRQSRAELVGVRDDIASAVAAYESAEGTWLRRLPARVLLDVGFTEIPPWLHLEIPDLRSAATSLPELRRRLERERARLNVWEGLACRRLGAALGLPGADEWSDEIPRLLAAGRALSGVHAPLSALGDAVIQLVLVADLRDEEGRCAAAAESAAMEVRRHVETIRDGLRGVEHPLPRRPEVASLALAVVPRSPRNLGHRDLAVLGPAVIDAAHAIWSRILDRLGWMASQAELAAGLEPLPGLRESRRGGVETPRVAASPYFAPSSGSR